MKPVKLVLAAVLFTVLLSPVSAIDINDTDSLDYWSDTTLDFRVDPDGTVRAQNNIDANSNNLQDLSNLYSNDGTSNFFGSDCAQGEVVVGVDSDGSYTCASTSSQVDDIWVNESGDTMTGNLDMNSANNIQNINALELDSTGDIRVDGTDAIRLDSSENVEVPNGDVDMKDGSGTLLGTHGVVDVNSAPFYLRPASSNTDFEIRDSGGTDIARFTDGNNVEIPNGNLNVGSNEITNLGDSFDPSDAVDKEYVDSSDDTIADDQDLQDVLNRGNSANDQSIVDLGALNITNTSTGTQIADFQETGVTLHQPLSVESSGPLSVANGIDMTDSGSNTIDSYSTMYLQTSSGSPSDIVLQPTGEVGVQSNATFTGDVNIDGNIQSGGTDAIQLDNSQNVDIANGDLTVSGQLSAGSTECSTGEYLDGDGSCTSVGGSLADEYVNESGDTMTGDLLIQDGSASDPELAFANDQDTGIYRDGGDDLGFAVGGARRMDITTADVMIRERLNLDGNNIIDVGGTTDASSGAVRLANGKEINWRDSGNNDDNGIVFDSADKFAFRFAGTDKFYVRSDAIDVDGNNIWNVGGTTDASSGAVRLANGVSIQARDSGNSNDIEVIGTDSSDNVQIGGSGNINNVEMPKSNLGLGTSSPGSRLDVDSGDADFSGGDLFVDHSAGQVGVGTSSPSAQLDVSGKLDANTVNTGQGDYELYAMDQNVRTSDSVTFSDVTTTNDVTVQGDLDVWGNITNTNVQNLNVNGSLLPPQDYSNTFDVGTSSRSWRNVYIDGHVNWGSTEITESDIDALDDGVIDNSELNNDWVKVSAGDNLTGGGSVSLGSTTTINHADTSSQADIDGSGGTVVQDVTVDDAGHTTGLSTKNLDNRYYKETEVDSNFVDESGDTMTDSLTVDRTSNSNGETVLQGHKVTVRDSGDAAYGYLEVETSSGTRGAYLGHGNGGSNVNLQLDNANELDLDGGDLDMNSNNINNHYDSDACPSGEVVADVYNNGSFSCQSITGAAQDEFVDETGDTMTGNLSMNGGNSIKNVQRVEATTFEEDGKDLVNKYVDEGGDSMSGQLNMNNNNLNDVKSIDGGGNAIDVDDNVDLNGNSVTSSAGEVCIGDQCT